MTRVEMKKNNRLGTVGGQAVIEGIMMKSADCYSVAVRDANGVISVIKAPFIALGEKYKPLSFPIVRGVVNFFQMLRLGNKALAVSVEAVEVAGEESKFDRWLSNHFGESVTKLIMPLSAALGIVLSIFLFSFLPAFLTITIDNISGGSMGFFKNLLEGLLRIGVFLIYLVFISSMKDMRRVFEYHGAEHKTIFCYEAHEDLTPENVQNYKRFHPRCGTSFLFVMMFLGIFLFSMPIFPWGNIPLRVLLKVACFPILAGLGYEFVRYAGRHDNLLVRILSAPGLWMQRITTKEPDLKQIEVAIAALKNTLSPEPQPTTLQPASFNKISDE